MTKRKDIKPTFYNYHGEEESSTPNSRIMRIVEDLKTTRPVINSNMVNLLQRDAMTVDAKVTFAQYQHIFEVVEIELK